MLPRRLLSLPLLFVSLACATTNKYTENFPGLDYGDPPRPTAVVCESEQMVLKSVDEGSFSSHLFGASIPLSRRVYHQYKIPAGKHTLYVNYLNKNITGINTNSSVVPLDATLVAGHTYILASNTKGVAFQGPLIDPLNWNPCLIDEANNQVITSASNQGK